MSINFRFLFILLFLTSISCQTIEKKKHPPLTTSKEEKDKYNFISPAIKEHLKKLDSRFTSLPFYSTELELIYTSYVTWEETTPDVPKEAKMGLVNFQHEEVLPNVYDKIYNPNGTVNGHLILQKDGLLGLFNYRNGKRLDCKYQNIFPPQEEGSIALVQRNGVLYSLLEDYTEIDVSKENPLDELTNKLTFDVNDTAIGILYDTYTFFTNEDPLEGNGIIVTPKYITDYISIPPLIRNIDRSKTFAFYSIEERSKVEWTTSLKNGLKGLITSYYQLGNEGRGYFNEKKHLVLLDSVKNRINSRLIYSTVYQPMYKCDSRDTLYMHGDSLVEVLQYTDYSKHVKYTYMPEFKYFKINPNGSIDSLKSVRVYNQTEYVLLQEWHFSGCYAQALKEVERKDKNNIMYTDYLDTNELDIMRNEIYASYGYAFKTKKWQDYFSKKTWYKPHYNNVDNLLSPIEKENIKTILRVRKLLSETPEKLNRRYEEYYAAG